MSQDAGEVSWQTLRRIVQRWSGDSAELDSVSALDGGSISTTLMLQTKAGDRAVLKVSPHRVDRSYEVEAHQLSLLRSIGLPAPQVYECHTGSLDAPDSYLLIEHMPGINLHDAKEQCAPEAFQALQSQLGQMVVALHQHTGARYGKVEPESALKKPATVNGATWGESGGESGGETWPAFYRGLYDGIWHECEKHSAIANKSRKLIGRIHDKLDRLLTHTDQPRLTHGDLWASNVLAAADEDGRWKITALLDPNCRFAHAECELAYLDLFHTITPAFMKEYQRSFKTDDDYHARRKHIYQLYELVNHVNLFGDRYIKPMQATLEKLSAFV